MCTSIYSGKERVVERWTRTGDDITVETVVEDPVRLGKPWMIAPRKIHLSTPNDYLITHYFEGGEVNSAMG